MMPKNHLPAGNCRARISDRRNRIVTQWDLERLGSNFRGAITVPLDSDFEDLLEELERIEFVPAKPGVRSRPDFKSGGG